MRREGYAVQRLTLNGFRGLEGSVELGPGLTLLVGPNCSGKTAVLEAMAYLVSVSYSNLRETHGYLMLLHASRGSVSHSLVSMVGGEGSEASSVAGIVLGEEGRVALSRSLSYESVGTMVQPVVEVRVESTRRNCSLFYRLESEQLVFGFKGGECFRGELKAAVVTPGVYPYNMFDELVGMAKKTRSAVWEALSKGIVIEGRRYSVDVASDDWGKLAAYVIEDGERMVSFYSVGRGLQRALIMLVALLSADVVLIDEIESAMHPGLLAEVSRRIAEAVKRGIQVVVATQSLEAARFLAAALLDLPPEDWRRPEALAKAVSGAEPSVVEKLSVVILDREGSRLKARTLRGEDAFDEIARGEDIRMLYTLLV